MKKIFNSKNFAMLLALVIGIMVMSVSIVYASQVPGDSTSQLEGAITNLNDGTGPYKILKDIMNIMAWFGFMIAIFKVIQIGIMFLTGTAGKRSGAKDSIMPWLIGAIICATFGTVGPYVISLFETGNDIFA